MEKPTHKRRQLLANCIKWDGTNTNEVVAWCESRKIEAELCSTNNAWLMLRGVHATGGLPAGCWLVEQENGDVRKYHQSKFDLLYEVIL